MILEIFSQVIPWHIPHPSINFFDPGPKNKNVYFFQIFEKKAEILENLNNWFRLMIYGMSTHLYVWMSYHIATLIWFLPSMNPHAIIRSPFWPKTCHIGCIDMVYPQCVGSIGRLTCNIPFSWEIFLTLAALVWFITSMSPQMHYEWFIQWESLITFSVLA